MKNAPLPATKPTETREAWLVRALPHLREKLTGAGAPVFPDPLISMSLPSKGAFAGKRQRIGECWAERASKSGKRCTIFLSPTLSDPVAVLDVFTHELIHASVGNKAGHGPKFKAVAVAVGLTGPMRATTAGPDLKKFLTDLAEKLGTFHHDALQNYKNPATVQTTRQRLYECAACGKKIRVASDSFLAQHFCDGDQDGATGMFTLKSSPNLPG